MDEVLKQMWWIIPVTLLLLAIIQTLYWLYLRNSVPSEKAQKVAQVTSPQMPTYPDNLVTRPLGDTSGMSNLSQPETTALGQVIPKMIMLNHPKGHKEIKLPEIDSFGIGRFYNKEYSILIALDERSTSRRHAVLRKDLSLNQYFLKDTNSSYGTAIKRNDLFQPMAPGEEERIYHNDVVQFGRMLEVRFELPGDTRQAVTGGR
jgi:hypothetical protein